LVGNIDISEETAIYVFIVEISFSQHYQKTLRGIPGNDELNNVKDDGMRCNDK
jgi:hypothetical protein